MVDDINVLFRLVGIGLALMLPLANPLTAMSLFLALGTHLSLSERKRQSRLAGFYAVLVMLVAYYAGSWIMHAFGISIPGLRISGGLIIAFLGFTMLFPRDESASAPDKPEAQASHAKPANIAFVPIALPGTAGPGTIAIIISLASKISESRHAYAPWVIDAAPVIVAVLLGLLLWVCLRSAAQLVHLIGEDGVEAISRIMGFLLVCMGVQFIIDGTYAVIALHSTTG